MADVAKAYVQIVPSAQGIKGSISKILGGEAETAGKSSGSSFASSLMSTATKVMGTLAVGKIITDSLFSGADLQQSMGGIETMFKDSADTMKQYATEAYKTTGLSANDYMEQATSFSASLLQSLGGDTAKASASANQALIDMADNSNKFGTSLDQVQSAYQGFAKGQYQLLDNLKLGYGGTKTEMERLLADAEKFSGVHYDIDNLNDVYSAIHVIQNNLGVTGTTAKEASQTFSGSFQMMKASADNFLASLTGVTDESGDAILSVQDSMSNLVESASTFLFGNLVPMLGNIILALPEALVSGFQAVLPILTEQGSNLLDVFKEGVIGNIPNLMSTASEMISNFASFIQQNLPMIVSSALSLIAEFTGSILQNLPQLLESGVQLLVALGQGILNSIPTIVDYALQICGEMINAFLNTDWISIGKNIIDGIGSGIANAVSGLVGKAIEACKTLADSVKSFFGIASPSRLFKGYGKYIDEGLALGITDNLGIVENAFGSLEKKSIGMIKGDLDLSTNVKSSNNSSIDRVILLLEQIASNSDKPIELNGRVLNRELRSMGVVY